jgi:acetoin utilization deacetylase AcuC-like enzyme
LGGYPGSGAAAEAGAGDGAGATVNLPLPGGAGHEAALAAWDEVVEPAVRRFKPDIIIVSAGFDAHWKDPLGALSWRSSTFHALAGRASALAAELCAGRLVLLLEGGYDLGALGESVASAFAGLLGRPAIDSLREALPEEPLERVRAAIRETQRVHGL